MLRPTHFLAAKFAGMDAQPETAMKLKSKTFLTFIQYPYRTVKATFNSQVLG